MVGSFLGGSTVGAYKKKKYIYINMKLSTIGLPATSLRETARDCASGGCGVGSTVFSFGRMGEACQVDTGPKPESLNIYIYIFLFTRQSKCLHSICVCELL